MRRVWWILVLLLLASSFALGRFANPSTVGSQFFSLAVAVLLLGVAWRMFERLLHAMYPTREEHTRAGQWTALGLLALVAGHALLVALGW
jgi:threonine/homoserine/homoserine lactone efflux protein